MWLFSPPSAPRPSGRRSQSEDSGHHAEKARSGAKPKGKKGSQHADVIDRLDFTGVGPMFHHDGPFDACAPSRNKHRNKAPMYAWGDDLTAAQLGDSAYPAAHAYKAFSNDYAPPPKKKVDAIAEAWGIHEPEPFEDFSAGGGRPDGDTPASSIYNGRDSHTRSAVPTRRPKDARDPRRRSQAPPPQPIFVGDSPDIDVAPSSPNFNDNPKRSRSIMQRIRKMRDAPNVPVGPDYIPHPPVSPTSPTDPTRPTHRSQNSFLGRFGAGGSRPNPEMPPNTIQTEKSEPFVLIETQNNNKELPAPPMMQKASTTPPSDNGHSNGYFDAQGISSSPGAGGLGRKTSLMKKMGRVVRGNNK
ncbi:Pal1 cell morphology protein-domain-containing protein [Crepidotus variabilis]|uniref:Pal1 cell morphology protein-domain-containing protein n=1 Tax=Crepidotus variabilis TaxID=179855 RepID=A0A9P6EUC3_9AGAR|nr:Pal1 cell morphology protein-domain-containing protein [Crepidotus variabilis]